jgi:hypothetical protein
MANFPSNPSNGNTHTIGNTIWVYNSTSDSWLIQDVNEYAVANLENTPPANPDEGTIWYDSQTTGRLYIYIDGNWIDASPGDISVITGGNDITATKSGTTYTLDVDDSFVRNTGDTVTGDVQFNSGANIHRGTHSSGYIVGSYNSVGANSDKTNPIYTIGSNYQPSDASLGNMYGIGYSHGNATYNGINSVLGGWGMYVAADGDARIGLDGSNGNINITGSIAVSKNNAAGGGIILADDGDIVDLNDGYCAMRFSSGVRVFSGNRSGSVRHTLHSNGTFSATGDVIAFASDNRLKNIEGRVENALDIVDKLNGYYYHFNELAGEFEYDTKSRQVGVSAQEVEAVIPEVVKPAPINEGNDTDYKTVQYEKLVPVLIEAIKELRIEIETLKANKVDVNGGII